jgi:hypothetical protein
MMMSSSMGCAAAHQGYLQDLDVAAAADVTARHTCSTSAATQGVIISGA